MSEHKEKHYKLLCRMASECRECPEVFHHLTYLNKNNGNINSPIMFIGEAPGFVRNPDHRLKSFYGNQSGWNFEHLLKSIGIERDSVFVTNALLHTPTKPSDRKYDNDYGYLQIRPPSNYEIKSCGKFLRRQVDLVNPQIICTLGRAALNACQMVFPNFPFLSLYNDVAKPVLFRDRWIFPLYHTSPNVTASIRPLKNMENDFKMLKNLIGALGIKL